MDWAPILSERLLLFGEWEHGSVLRCGWEHSPSRGRRDCCKSNQSSKIGGDASLSVPVCRWEVPASVVSPWRFSGLWKDADPDAPPLLYVKADYRKLGVIGLAGL